MVPIAARYALQSFVYFDSVAGKDIHVEQGAVRDSVTGQAFLETPASMWSTTPLTAGSQISPTLAAYLVAYPAT
jgi:hypothetical protein